MNPLERSLVEKDGYDNGWEHVVGTEDGKLLLASSRHPGRALIGATDDGAFLVSLLPAALAAELAQPARLGDPSVEAPESTADDWVIRGRPALAAFLRTVARVAQALPDQPERDYAAELAQTLGATLANGTEVERLVRQRIGQDVFRKAQIQYWGGACAVTGLDLPDALRASHAKPWADCTTDTERLDVFNGFLLAAHLDALFDRGLITFADDGLLVHSAILTASQASLLHLVFPSSPPLRLRWITQAHLPYLAWHRERVYRPT